MFVPELFHLCNDSICFVLGYIFNFTLIWMIVKKTPSEMNQYKPILLQSCVINIIYLAVYLIVQPVMVIDSGLAAIFQLDPFRNAPQPWNLIVCCCWMFNYQFSQYALAVPFVYRYLVICKNKTLGLNQFFALLSIPFVFALGQLCVLFWGGYNYNEEDNAFFFPDPEVQYKTAYFTQTYFKNCVVVAYVMFMVSNSYNIIFAMGLRIYRHLNKVAFVHLHEKRARELNFQISSALLAQAVMPLVIELIPTFHLASFCLFKSKIGAISGYETGFFVWVPVLNPIVTLVVQAT